jgi:hypothetical protein
MGERIERRFVLRQKAVDHQELLGQADCGQFAMGSRGFNQRGVLSAGDKDQTRALSIRQHLYRRLILSALLGEPRKRAKTGGVALPRFKETTPRHWELQQTNRVAGWRCIENDVVEG